MNVNNYCSN